MTFGFIGASGASEQALDRNNQPYAMLMSRKWVIEMPWVLVGGSMKQQCCQQLHVLHEMTGRVGSLLAGVGA